MNPSSNRSSDGASNRSRGGAIVASVLNADLARLGEVCSGLESAGLDAIQWDVMDARFVPNLTVGPATIAACRGATALPFEAHLMIVEPERWIDHYVEAGCEYVIVHEEASVHLHRTLERSWGGNGAVVAGGEQRGECDDSENEANPLPRVERGIKDEGHEQERNRYDHRQSSIGALLALVFTGPIQVVAFWQP